MFNKINFKLLLLGVVFFLSGVNTLYIKIYVSSHDYRVGSRPSIYDGYFGFILVFIEMFLAICIISYSLSLNNRLSKIGKVIVDFIIKVFNKVNKKWKYIISQKDINFKNFDFAII